MTWRVLLDRGEVLVVDQRRIAHGRMALGDQSGLAQGARRWLVQAKVAGDPTAPAPLVGSVDHG